MARRVGLDEVFAAEDGEGGRHRGWGRRGDSRGAGGGAVGKGGVEQAVGVVVGGAEDLAARAGP